MATFDMSSHHLEFQDDYKKILVFGTGTSPIAEYDLQTANQSVSVAVDGDDYVLLNTTDFSEATMTLDVGAGTTLGFDGTKMGGIGIVDLRDMKAGGPYTIDMTFDLECTAFKLKYVSGPYALKLKFTPVSCFTYKEA